MLVFLVTLFILHTAVTESPQCSEQALHTWCTNDMTQTLAGVFYECEQDFTFEEKRCRVNERGKLCGLFVDHLTDLKRAKAACSNQSFCSTQCSQLLNQLKDSLGCCLNEMLNVTVGPQIFSHLLDYQLWKNCSLDFPTESCQPSQLAKIPKPQVAPQQCSFREFFQKQYQVQCSNTKIKALADAYDNQNCNQLSKDLYSTCTVTDEGVWCVEDFVKKLSNSEVNLQAVIKGCGGIGCSPTCKNSLLRVKSELGCCFNFILNNTFFQGVYSDYAADNLVAKAEVWAKCGVPHPQNCKVKLYNGGETSVHAPTAVIIMAITLNFVVHNIFNY